MRGMPYPEIAARVLHLFVGDCIAFDALQTLCRDAYAGFGSPAVAPLVQLETGLWSLELFHGPTLAFKDMAMQVLGRMFDLVLRERGERVTIVAATSGDTGSAAIEAFQGRGQLDVVVMHPQGRTSEVQRRQMTTVKAANIANIAVDGTFDDCQDLVKAMFSDAPFRTEMRLSAVNSINWARVAAQIPYYVASAVALGSPDREVAFSVPTGNFGNVPRRLGRPPHGRPDRPPHRRQQPQRHPDPLPRLQRHEHPHRRAEPVAEHGHPGQQQFRAPALRVARPRPGRHCRRHAGLPAPTVAWACPKTRGTGPGTLFQGFRLDDPGTEAEIRRLWAQGYLADPHTAIGVAAAPPLPARPHPDHRRRHRPPGQVPRRDAGGHRNAAPPAIAAFRPI